MGRVVREEGVSKARQGCRAIPAIFLWELEGGRDT
jgi:hypothetical protein